MKRLAFHLLFSMLPVYVWCNQTTIDGITYTYQEYSSQNYGIGRNPGPNETSISDYFKICLLTDIKGNVPERLIIPDSIDGYIVTGIACSSSDENAYLYTATSCKYEIKDDKDNPFNHINSGDFTINGDISVSKYKKTAASVEVATSNAGTFTSGNFITYESVSNNKYFSGYRFKDNQLKIYQHIEVNDEFVLANDTDPLKNIKPGVVAKTEIISDDHPLYDFYTYLGTL